MNTRPSYTIAMNTLVFKRFVFLSKIIFRDYPVNKILSASVTNWAEMMMSLSLLWSFAEVVSKPPRHCPSCVKRCRCAYTGGTWLLRCCQLLLHLFLATCNKRAPDCSGASQCLLPHPRPLSYYFFQSRPFDMIHTSCLLPVGCYN